MLKISRLLPLVLLACALPARADHGWLEVKSPHFTVITDAGAKRGHDVALHFEQMRIVFGDLFTNTHVSLPVPLEIIVLRNSGELRPLSPVFQGKPVELGGFFEAGQDRCFIAVDESSDAGWEVAYHEYAHQLLQGNFPPTAPWFDEGFAEFLQGMHINKDSYEVGAPPQNLGDLNAKLLPSAELFSVSHHSETYNKTGTARSTFYMQSWLTVHYLYEHQKLKETAEYFRLVNREHVPIAEAIQKAFGVDAAHFDQEIAAYRRGNRIAVIREHLPRAVDPSAITVTPLAPLDARAALADLKFHSADHRQEAVKEFQEIIQVQPDNLRAQRGLGYAYLYDGDFDKALERFRQAARLSTTDPRVYYFAGLAIARRSMSTGKPPIADLAEMKSDLQKAISLDPSFADAYSILAFANMVEGDHGGALANCKKAAELNPRNELYVLNLARAYLAAGQPVDARNLLEKLKDSPNQSVAYQAQQDLARAEPAAEDYSAAQRHKIPGTYDAPQWRRSEAQIEQPAEQETRTAAPDTRPTKYLRGELVAVDCADAPAAILSIRSAGRTLKMMTTDTSKLVLIGADQFSCSWKDRKVLVNYKAGGKTDGDLVSLEVE